MSNVCFKNVLQSYFSFEVSCKVIAWLHSRTLQTKAACRAGVRFHGPGSVRAGSARWPTGALINVCGCSCACSTIITQSVWGKQNEKWIVCAVYMLSQHVWCMPAPPFLLSCLCSAGCVCVGGVGGGASRVTVAAHLSALPYAALCKNRVLLRGLMVNPIQVP